MSGAFLYPNFTAQSPRKSNQEPFSGYETEIGRWLSSCRSWAVHIWGTGSYHQKGNDDV
nr:MAG TPA: hypothetical protein [Caudoviricetes sp.]